MNRTIQVQLAQRGVLTLPKRLRDVYNLKVGDSLTLLDLGGVFVLSLRNSRIDSLTERISEELTQKGETLEGMLKTLREEREKYGDES